MLTRLPLSGNKPLIVGERDLSKEESRMISLLLQGDETVYAHSHPTPNAWVSFFRPRYLDDMNTHIAAFLAVWLDCYVFPSSFIDPN